MLLVYRRTTGEVLDNTGTSSAFPDGPPDDQAYVNTDARGHQRTDLALLRLHDTDDAEQVQLALTRRVKVKDGTLVDLGPLPTPPPRPPSERELRVAGAKAKAARGDTAGALLDLLDLV